MKESFSMVAPLSSHDFTECAFGIEEGGDVAGKEDTTEHLKALLRQEADLYPLCNDYLSSTSCSGDSVETSSSERVSEAWRRKLCEWCFEVVDHFNFDREVVSFALDYLDRTVAIKTESAGEALPKREFQLHAVTSLYMAIKIHGETDDMDGPRRKLRIGAFVELSRGFFSVETIEEMERSMLELLNWCVNPPSTLRFLSSLLSLIPTWTPQEHPTAHAAVVRNIYDVSRYLTELSVCVSSFSFGCKTSVISYASILCAIEALQSPLPYFVRVSFLNNIAEATGLYPGSEDVRQVYSKLKELCPHMFVGEDPLMEFQVNVETPIIDGKISPISVIDRVISQDELSQQPDRELNEEDSPLSRRKRRRSYADEKPTSSQLQAE